MNARVVKNLHSLKISISSSLKKMDSLIADSTGEVKGDPVKNTESSMSEMAVERDDLAGT